MKSLPREAWGTWAAKEIVSWNFFQDHNLWNPFTAVRLETGMMNHGERLEGIRYIDSLKVTEVKKKKIVSPYY